VQRIQLGPPNVFLPITRRVQNKRIGVAVAFGPITVVVFKENNYNRDFIRHNTYGNSEPNTTNTNATPVTTATISYIKGTSETVARILQPYNIRVAHKPITTLRQLLTNVKDKDEPSDRQGSSL